MSGDYSRIVYFEKPGRRNTDELLRLARERAEELEIRDIIVASSRGRTGLKAVEVFQGYNVVVIGLPQAAGYPSSWVMGPENKQKIEELGGKVLIGVGPFASLGRALWKWYGHVTLTWLMADTLRVFGEGAKVCVEIALMAVDADLVSPEREVIAIGGTGTGADTALVIKPAGTSDFFKLEVREIIAKPRSNLRLRRLPPTPTKADSAATWPEE